MICYMPHSYLSPEWLHRLGVFFRRFAVFAPADYLLTEPMRLMKQQGVLDIRFPRGVDETRLRRVISEFDEWADFHRGDMGSLRDFFKTSLGNPPLVNETDTTQISTQIRHFETLAGGTTSSGESLFQEALFLALAHRYDTQQESLGSEMGAIEEMEQRMYSQMSGSDNALDPSEAGVTIPPKDVQKRNEAEFFMVERRIRSWAALAAADPDPFWAYVTGSQQVLENLLEFFSEAQRLALWQLSVPQAGCENPDEMVPDLSLVLKKLAFSKDLKAVPLVLSDQPVLQQSTCEQLHFSLFALPDCPPPEALARIRKGGEATVSSAAAGAWPSHTLIGYLSCAQ